jgi:hypothetical protein
MLATPSGQTDLSVETMVNFFMVMILDDRLEFVRLSEGEQQCCHAAFYFTFATNSTVVLPQPRPNLCLIAIVLKLRTALGGGMVYCT